jgi:hypothetical protein
MSCGEDIKKGEENKGENVIEKRREGKGKKKGER